MLHCSGVVGAWLVTAVIVMAVPQAENWFISPYGDSPKGLALEIIYDGYLPRVFDGCVAQW